MLTFKESQKFSAKKVKKKWKCIRLFTILLLPPFRHFSSVFSNISYLQKLQIDEVSGTLRLYRIEGEKNYLKSTSFFLNIFVYFFTHRQRPSKTTCGLDFAKRRSIRQNQRHNKHFLGSDSDTHKNTQGQCCLSLVLTAPNTTRLKKVVATLSLI